MMRNLQAEMQAVQFDCSRLFRQFSIAGLPPYYGGETLSCFGRFHVSLISLGMANLYSHRGVRDTE